MNRTEHPFREEGAQDEATTIVRDLLGKQGMTPRGGTPEQFGGMVRKELARWDRVVKAANIKAD